MKFFTKEVKIGLTAIVAICLCYYIISFMKGINIFKSSNTYYVKFENIQGLTVSTNVFANGYPVGIVRDINYDYATSKSVVVAVELNKDMRVPVGTSAELQSSLMGGVTMNLILGPNPAQFIAHGDTIVGGPHKGPITQVQKAIPDILAMVPKLDSIMTNLSRLSANPHLDDMINDAAQTAHNLNAASSKLNALMDNEVPVMVKNLNETSQNVNKLTKNLSNLNVNEINSTLHEAQGTLKQVTSLTKSLNNTAETLNHKLSSKDNSLGLLLQSRGLYDNLNSTVQNADSLMVDLRKNPKRYVHFSLFGKRDKTK